MERNPEDGTGPVHVPFGHIVANEKWRGSQLAQDMQGKIKLVFEDGLAPVDFYLSTRCCILYVKEADLVAGNSYRKRLVRVRNSSNLQGIVIVEKTQMSEQYFPAIQKFTVLDLGMVLLPVANQVEASCLIIQLSYGSSFNNFTEEKLYSWHVKTLVVVSQAEPKRKTKISTKF
ncbi:Fanconi anemia core complex-associated protein 24 isoform X2 [Phyllostomus discolor]|uniref:Fanconi anemia core complex-associated protein 24 isoform X2 n=1 Tax=Phyllostomus discolor TaxID=89673 RepID=A0A7E6CPA1_9CHIR|nr:Fanconi anemia core complex-associated protein 24 isoform X2 [Phyllostomus discolor]